MKWIRQKYYITERKEKELIVLLVKKSEVSEEETTRIFDAYKRIRDNKSEVSDTFLSAFFKNIENFKKKSK